jgi:hypothetical protein
MAATNKGHQRNRVSYDILNNLSSVDQFYEKKIFKKIKGTCSFMYEQNDTNGSFFVSYTRHSRVQILVECAQEMTLFHDVGRPFVLLQKVYFYGFRQMVI